MQNLPSNKDPNPYVEEELIRARIDIVSHDDPRRGEAATIGGKLGRFTFFRHWCYWVAEGAMPIGVAHALLDDPEGRASVRIDGFSGNRTHEDLDNKINEGQQFVYTYHIDDQAGLRLFADTIRRHNLMGEEA